MARYNTFRYSEQKYGTSPANNNLLWTFIVDWDKDGLFSGANEAERMVDFRLERGRDYMLNPGGRGFEKMKVGKVVATFDNNDGRYDPYNTSSPLYPDVSPGGQCQILVKDTNTGTNYGVLYGVVDDIQPVRINNQPHARITVKDGMRWLQDKLTGPTTQESQTLQTIAEWIISNVSSPWTISADDSGLMTSYTPLYWWTWKVPAYDDLYELAKSEVAVFFHGRDGVFYFYNRDYTHNRSKAVTQSEILRDIYVPQPWEIIRNSVECEYHSFDIEDLDIPGVSFNAIWIEPGTHTASTYLIVPNGETITLDATFEYQNRRMAGYNVRLASSLGVYDLDLVDDITANCSADFTTPVGGGTYVTVTNNAGEDGYLTSLALYGDVLYSNYQSSRRSEDATSQATYGDRSLKVGALWTDPTAAEDIADWLLADLKDPSLYPTIQFEDRPSYQFYFDLWDRMQLTVAKMGINANFRVGKIEHEWLTPNGQQVRTTMKLEPYLTVFS